MANISILDNPIRVSVPFIKVTIGDYTFGVYQESSEVKRTSEGVYTIQNIQYPNYLSSLSVTKINGKVNQYSCIFKYAITQDNDPNFFEKVFSKSSKVRKIVFSYGDLSAPQYLYKNEEALIIGIDNNIDINNAVITYTVSAVSSGTLATAGAHTFPALKQVKPSDIIKQILKNNSKYGLLNIFPGMRDTELVEQYGLIASNDITVDLKACSNMNTLDYIKYLVNSMKDRKGSKTIYTMQVIDDTSGIFNGPYFKITSSTKASDSLDTYVLDVGYPSNNVVISFNLQSNEAYSILYNYSQELNKNDYIQRINDNGVTEAIYSPNIASANEQNKAYESDLNWWNNVTEFPISATIRIKGVLRPTLLMSKVRLNILFYGKKYISSGLYIINKQVDDISADGCFTTLNLVRVGGDE